MPRMLYELQGVNDIRPSPYCWRTRMALAHKGLAAEFVPVQFGEKDEIASSGQNKVPVLDDDGRVIHDSWAIACYLEEAYPGRLSLFGSEAARAGARFINSWDDNIIHTGMLRLVMLDIFEKGVTPSGKDYFRTSREKRLGMSLEEFSDTSECRLKAFRRKFEPVRLALDESPYLAGESPLYGDYALFGTCKFLELCSSLVIFPEDDPISKWYERMLDLFDGYARTDGGAGGGGG